MIIHGEALAELQKMEDNSIDTIITDPPYGLSFMGKKWDYDVPTVELWTQCLRVLKPGGTALIFAGSRTQHRMAVNVEDAGFILKDCIMYLYGSGFPKATDISKQLGKGHKRKVVGNVGEMNGRNVSNHKKQGTVLKEVNGWEKDITEPATPEAKLWNGWKSHGLKPAYEPILVAMKPNDGTYANNALVHGVSGLNIDGGRIGTETTKTCIKDFSEVHGNEWGKPGAKYPTKGFKENPPGRFPANLILDEEAGAILDEQSGVSFSSGGKGKASSGEGKDLYSGYSSRENTSLGGFGDKGGASRYFKECSICEICPECGIENQKKYAYCDVCGTRSSRMQALVDSVENKGLSRIKYCAKASKTERNAGLDCTLTVKYNSGICKEENMEVAQLLRKVTYDTEIVSFNIDESGENIMAQCHKDSLSTILTGINKTIESKTLNSLQHFITNGFIQGVNYEVKIGINPAENVESLSKYLHNITKGNQESALGVSRAVLKMLSLIKEKENWNPLTNIHSTVKPLALMEYLCKLTATPTGGKVLDPFAGSGTTGVACKKLGRDFVLIEREEEYIKIIEARLK